MSIKSSLSYYEYNTKHEIHIYKNTMTGDYCLEDENSKVKLPKFIAEEFAKILNKLMEKEKSNPFVDIDIQSYENKLKEE